MLVLIPDGIESNERSAGHEACLTCVAAQERRAWSEWTRFSVSSQFSSVSVGDCFGLELGGSTKLLLVTIKGSSFVPLMYVCVAVIDVGILTRALCAVVQQMGHLQVGLCLRRGLLSGAGPVSYLLR